MGQPATLQEHARWLLLLLLLQRCDKSMHAVAPTLPFCQQSGGVSLQRSLIKRSSAAAAAAVVEERERNTEKTHNYQQQSKWAIWGHGHLIGS